jgi:hypothetical protein
MIISLRVISITCAYIVSEVVNNLTLSLAPTARVKMDTYPRGYLVKLNQTKNYGSTKFKLSY